MANPILAITDGTTRVNLLVDGTTGIGVCDWTPARPTFKDDGVWANSSISDGRQLQMRKWENIIDVFTINISDCSQDRIIAFSRSLTALLEKAVQYWVTEWQNEPVWIERRGAGETNISYSLINSYKWASDDNPFEPPFYGVGAQLAMAEIDLAIEHGAWLSNQPGECDCLEISNLMIDSGTEILEYPTESGDDAYTLEQLYPYSSSISLTGDLIIGNVFSSTWKIYNSGIRFRNVSIPAGANILYAAINLVSKGGIYISLPVESKIYGELNATPAVFSTYADFIGRSLTSNRVGWTMDSYSLGTTVQSPDIKEIVQEIVDLGGWASGNDMTIIIKAGDAASRRFTNYFASWDDADYDKPELYVVYSVGDYAGRAPTCLDEVYVANKDNTSQLTHIYTYDSGTATYSSNLIGSTSYDIFPNPSGVDDITYFGVDSTRGGPFCSLIFDIETARVGGSFETEYYNGSSWDTLLGIYDKGNRLNTTGCIAMIFTPPSDWTTVAVNGVTAYWVRCRATFAMTTVPKQQNRSVYTVTKSSVDIGDDAISGDITAIGKINITTIDTSRGKAEKIIIGLRSLSRGDFVQHINTNGQNNNFISVTADSLTAVQTNIDTPTGSGLRTSFAGSDAMARRLYFDISDPTSAVYFGRYRAFIRAIETTTTKVLSEGDIKSYLKISMGSSSETKTVSNIYADNYWYYFDYGIVTIPPFTIPESYVGTVTISVYASNDNASPAKFEWVDLILLPVDEYALEIIQDGSSISSTGDISTIDSVSYLDKKRIFSVLRKEADYQIYDMPSVIAPSQIQFQANTDQRVYFFVPSKSKYEWLGRIQMWKNERYLTFRGDS